MPLVHLASRLYGTPLLIARSKLDVILSVLGPRIGLQHIESSAPKMALREPPELRRGGIAIIPIHGTLVRRAMPVEAASGLISYGEIGERLDEALADPLIEGILLDIDSPGGEAGGVFELASRIRAATTIKPIWAHANDSAYSAAYALAAAASRLTLSETAGVGSIGVIALHVDQSVKDAKEGLAFTAIYAGHHKNDFSPHAPLSPQAVSSLQSEVDRLYGIFVQQVASYRDLDPAAVQATEASLLFGEQALNAGLADAVLSMDRVLSEFSMALKAGAQRGAPIARVERRGAPVRASPQSPQGVVPLASHIPLSLENTMTSNEALTMPEIPAAEPQCLPGAADSSILDVSEPSAVLTPPAPSATAQVTAQRRIDAQAIAELCLIAGASPRTAEFLSAGLSEAQVRQVLLEARATQPEISSRISAESASSFRAESSPVVAAVKKMTSKE
jgi:signal peptide peptidase SppA